ncbi:hypothetical protein IAT38_001449 [Cryptococcus sp. DSM 104549]
MPHFPLHEYFPLLIYLSFILLLSFITLPHSTAFLFPSPLTQSSSADRPEHPFLTPITARPLVTMLWDVLGMGVCMGWWGGRMKGWWEGSGKGKGAGAVGERGLVGENELEERRVRGEKNMKRLINAGATTLAGVPVFYVVLTVMGAPLDSHYLQTILLSLHLSILTVWPVIHTLGIPSLQDDGIFARFRLTRLFCEFRTENPIERALVYPPVGALLGAWLGALPIPLDWDRPWQSYPLTIAFASILGFIFGGFASWSRSVAESMYKEIQSEGYVVGEGEGKEGGKAAKKNKKKKKAVAA